MRRPRLIRLAVVCASVLLLGGLTSCGDDSEDRVPSSTATSTSTASTTTSTTVADPVDLLVLEPDGIGSWTLGSEADTVIAGLTNTLGAPNTDTGWLSSEDPSSTMWGCPYPEARAVNWDDLSTYFANPGQPLPPDYSIDYAPADGSAYFLGYEAGGAFRTVAGIGVGSTLTELRAAYGTDLILVAQEYPPEWWFRIGGTSPGAWGWGGRLSAASTGYEDTAEPDDETTTVTGLHGGNFCWTP